MRFGFTQQSKSTSVSKTSSGSNSSVCQAYRSTSHSVTTFREKKFWQPISVVVTRLSQELADQGSIP